MPIATPLTSDTPGDVKRILHFSELPASVRRIPKDFNPLNEGVLMKHQREFAQEVELNDVTVCEKGRRTGITFTAAQIKTIKAASSAAAGGTDVYYVGDTKDKGLEFIGYCTHLARVMAMAMADGFLGIEVFIFEDQDENGVSKKQTAYRIRFASGFQIVALSSNPANIRGLQGDVIIDEAAFHRDVQGVIDACSAMLIWGGNIIIISTHNGEDNAFNQLVKDIRAGLFDFKLLTYTFDDAVANGLFERVCLMRGWEPTTARKEKWYDKVRGIYGANHDAMHEELDAIPRQGSGIAISSILIEACMQQRPVIRWEKTRDWEHTDVIERQIECDKWIDENLRPLFNLFSPEHPHYFGFDYGRVSDMSSIAPLFVDGDLVRQFPFIVEMSCIPIAQQKQILWCIIDNMPKFSGGGMDATGMGHGMAEDTADKYGRDRIEQISLNDKWYLPNGEKYQRAFVERTIVLPRNQNVKNDVRTLAKIQGVIKLPAVKVKDAENQKLKRHGDTAISTMIGYSVSFSDYKPPAGVNIEAKAQDKYVAARLVDRLRPGRLFRRTSANDDYFTIAA